MKTLADVRIVTTAVNVPGPVAAAMLRDRGATVIKVEPPAGDPLSWFAPRWYADLCAGIELQRLDLKSAEGRERLDAHLASADLLITASRPASLQRLGLAWTALHVRYPRLCQVAIVGYGAPREDVAGHDLTYQADAGLITPPTMPSTLIADLSGAQRVVIEAVTLLYERRGCGQGGYAAVALAECATLFAEPRRHGLTIGGGPLGGSRAAYGLYETRDGWVAVAALEPHFRAALARELRMEADDRLALAAALKERSAAEWVRWAEARDLPIAVVRE